MRGENKVSKTLKILIKSPKTEAFEMVPPISRDTKEKDKEVIIRETLMHRNKKVLDLINHAKGMKEYGRYFQSTNIHRQSSKS